MYINVLAALFMVAPERKSLKCPSTGEQITTRWSIYGVSVKPGHNETQVSWSKTAVAVQRHTEGLGGHSLQASRSHSNNFFFF